MKFHTMSVNGALSNRIGSHRAAWVRMRQAQEATRGNEIIMYDKHENMDPKSFGEDETVLVYLGMEWSGALNLFGGNSDENAIRLGWPTKCDNQIFFLDEDPVDLPKIMGLRKYDEGSMWDKVLHSKRVQRIYNDAGSLKQPEFSKMIMGDSHSLSQFSGDEHIVRKDGKTLHGALSQGLETMLPYHPEQLMLYFGSIDVRFHIHTQPNPEDAIRDMLREYHKQLVALKKTGIEISLVELMPIESEDRKMAQTGMYKGKPFYGSHAQRAGYRDLFNEFLLKSSKHAGFTLYGHPSYFCDLEGRPDLFNQQYMEPAKGVHSSWEYSRFERNKRGEEDVVIYTP